MKLKRLILGQLGTNCYIVYDEESKEAIVFDPADNAEKINGTLNELGLNTLYIVITHAHCDHIAALDELVKSTGAKVCIGEHDADALNDSGYSLCSAFGCTAPDTKADVILKDGSIIYLGGRKIEFITTPGHTRGGICAYFGNTLISGDTLFRESVGRSDFPGGSMAVLVNSIKTKLYCLPDDTEVFPGHGESTTIGHEKKNNPFVW